jgi:hypothetical protein
MKGVASSFVSSEHNDKSVAGDFFFREAIFSGTAFVVFLGPFSII